jgi:ferrous iron transport protein A
MAACRLAQLHKGDRATVSGIAPGGADGDDVRLRLMELGFVPGEPIRVVAESFPGGDPMAVRVGNSTFALRRHEAMWVEVTGVTT